MNHALLIHDGPLSVLLFFVVHVLRKSCVCDLAAHDKLAMSVHRLELAIVLQFVDRDKRFVVLKSEANLDHFAASRASQLRLASAEHNNLMRVLSRQHHGSVESDRLIVDLHLHIFIEGFFEATGDDPVVLKSEQFERVDSKFAPDLLDKIFPLAIFAFFEPLQILELAILNRWQEIAEFFFVEGSAADSEHHK